ncbi:hypothetical protein HQ590_15585, partial [bacterium]|nr:hypothetical protein [bacterium]
IDSPVTLLSAARTYAALHRASLLADSATAGGNLGAVLARARNVVTSAAKGYLEGGTNLPPLGGLRLPQEFAIELDPLLTKPGDPQQTNYELWLQMADKLLQQQRKNGSWGRLRRTDYPYYSHVDGLKEDGYAASLLARARIKAERHYEAEQAKLPPAKRKPYDPEANLWRSAPVYGAHHALRLQASVVATAYAMIALAQGVRPPILGVWTWDDQPPRSPVPRAVINALSKDKHIPFTYRLLSPDLPLEAIREVPVVYFGVSSPFAPTTAAALPNLEYYLRNRGLVVVEGAAGNDGQAILDQCQRKLLELAPDAQPGPLTPLVTGVNLQGLLVDSNQTVAVFYPVTADNPPAPGTIRLPDAARYTYQLLAQTAGPELLSPSYAIRWPLIEEAERKEAEEKARKEAEEAAKKAAKEAGVTPAEEAK